MNFFSNGASPEAQDASRSTRALVAARLEDSDGLFRSELAEVLTDLFDGLTPYDDTVELSRRIALLVDGASHLQRHDRAGARTRDGT